MSPLGPDTRALLAAARGARPSRSARSRIDARFAMKLGVAAAVAAAPAALAPAAPAALTSAALAPAAAPVAAAVGGGAFGLKGVLLAAVLVVGGGVVIGSTVNAPDRAGMDATAASSLAAITTERAVGLRERERAKPVAPPEADNPLPAAAEVAPRPTTASDAPEPRPATSALGPPSPRAGSAPSSGGLGRDSALMGQALRSLRDGDPDAALQSLDALGSAQPNGALAEERLAARVVALCAAGRIDEAKAAAADFLARYPGSVQASQVRASCAR